MDSIHGPAVGGANQYQVRQTSLLARHESYVSFTWSIYNKGAADVSFVLESARLSQGQHFPPPRAVLSAVSKTDVLLALP
jgi:hypothetical protein